jgi:transposase
MEQRRLRAAELFEQGQTQAEVARTLRVSRQSAHDWYVRWQANGTDGLRAAGRAGRRPRLSVEQREAISQALLQGARAHGFDTDLWTLARVATVVEEVTGIAHHPGHVWRVLKSMGWSLQRPARRAAERDEQAIARWVREDWPRIKKGHAGARQPSSSSTKAASR